MKIQSTTHTTPLSRRGSAILIVVGTLALIAVFAAIYISIGQSDQRVARSIANKQEIEGFQNTFADHIGRVIADDRLDTIVQRKGNSTGIFTIRELTDAPYTDRTMRSAAPDSEVWTRFNPSGRHTHPGPAADSQDFRVASDPWLASTSPTFIGNPGQPRNGDDDRPFGSLITAGALDPLDFIGKEYSSSFLDKRDWRQITNVAPDGRFVNLFNLRPNAALNNGFADSTIGGFDSEPGTSTFIRPSDNRSIRRMSNYLSLWKPLRGDGDNPDPESEIQAFDPEADGIWLPGQNDPVQNHGFSGGELANVPAVWSMYQRFMFQPINQPFTTFNRFEQVSTWADPDFAPYQYADADGDGMIDARWFELTSAQSDPTPGNTPRGDIERLYDAGQYRLFAAARIVDLSSLVNVNTAMDQLAEPNPTIGSRGAPMGATPAEVDLRRLLSLSDPAHSYSILQLAGLSPSNFHKPVLTTNNELADTDYKWYRSFIIPDEDRIEPSTNAFSVGRYAYDAIKRGIEFGEALDERYYSWPPVVRATNSTLPTAPSANDFDDDFNVPDADFTSVTQYRLNQYASVPGTNTPLDAQTRAEWYDNIGRLNPFSTQEEGNGAGSLYGADDLLELLTFHGLNDPSTLSRLEKSAMGRMPSVFEQNQRAFSPLLSNRPLSLDRDRHGFVDQANYAISAPSEPRLIMGGIAKESMAFFSVTPRRLLTTVSGAAPIRGGDVLGDVDMQPANLELTLNSVLPTLEEAFEDPQTLFGVYQRALAGELNPEKVGVAIEDLFERDSADLSTARNKETATLFYGHRGPELALRIAAHITANSIDLYDLDKTPTVTTLLMDNSRRDDFGITNFPTDNPNPANAFYRDFPGVADGNLLDPDSISTVVNSSIPGSTGSAYINDEHRQAVNVYGIEPSPIITEVTSFYVYHDMSDAAGGDEDYLTIKPRVGSGGIILPGIPAPGNEARITINSSTDPVSNSDMMMHGIAFQLHNPFSVPVELGGEGLASGAPLTRQRVDDGVGDIDPTANYQFEYYIEWHGYFFKLAEYIQYYPPSSAARESEFRTIDEGLGNLGENSPHIDFASAADDDPNNGGYIDPVQYSDYVGRNVVMQPGETRVFYVMADPRFDTTGLNNESIIDTKWRNALSAFEDLPSRFGDTGPVIDFDRDGIPDGYDRRGWTGPAKEWLHRQFESPLNTNFGRPIMMHPMNPRTGEYLEITPPGGFYDYLGASGAQLGADTDGRNDIGEARLWRKIVTPSEETTDTTVNPKTSENLLQNDLLVDRIKVDAVAQPLTEDGEIMESFGFPEDYPETGPERATNIRNDNTGLTVIRWASTSRRDSADETDPGLSQVRQWMLSSRIDPDSTTVSATDAINLATDFDLDTEFTLRDFIESTDSLDSPLEPIGAVVDGEAPFRTNYEVHRTLRDLWDHTVAPPRLPALVTIGLEPELKSDLDSVAPDNGTERVSMEIYNRDSDGELLNPVNNSITLHETNNTDRTNQRPDLFSSAREFNGAPRLGDLLLAWGIGPTFAPTANGSLDNNDLDPGYYPEEWITMTEALAIALGYERPVASAIAADNIWAETFTAQEQTLDNGHLVLDNYVPYYNIDTTEDPPEFTVVDDIRRGNGIPMALSIMDQTRPLLTLDNTADQLTTPTYGLVNINTAPVEVLRLLPGLSPSITEYYPDNAVDATDAEWWANGRPLDLPDLSTALSTPDIAATMLGYRDRQLVQPRAQSAVQVAQDLYPINYAPANADDFNDLDNSDRHAFNLVNEEPADLTTAGTRDHRDRQTIAGIDGIRATPGFASLGEVLAVTLSDTALGAGDGIAAGLPLISQQPHLSIQQYGNDAVNLDGFVDDAEYALDPQIYIDPLSGGFTNSPTPDDYAERLAIANGILNTISVRSDYFAVWFVVHAYQPSDVENLQPEDPLVPSIAKRYVMVIDRTNVKAPGDTPKVVFLKEVPM